VFGLVVLPSVTRPEEAPAPRQSCLVREPLFELSGYSPAAALDRPVKAHDLAVQLDQPFLDSPPGSRLRMLFQRPRDFYMTPGLRALEHDGTA